MPGPNHCIECDIPVHGNSTICPRCEDKEYSNTEKFQLFRCKCGKTYGSKNHLKICKRCNDKVIARKEYDG